MGDEKILHQDDVEEVIGETREDSSDVGVIADHVAAAGANPTKAEYDGLVTKFNQVLEVLRDSGQIPTA